MMGKPILCLDFDGVLHSYDSGWRGAIVVSDPPVPGAMAFLFGAIEHFDVQIFSSRSGWAGGVEAMQCWLRNKCLQFLELDQLATHAECENMASRLLAAIKWPTEKPPAMVTIDDRALTFRGSWPTMRELLDFKPWNKGGLTDPCGYCIDGLQADGETSCPCFVKIDPSLIPEMIQWAEDVRDAEITPSVALKYSGLISALQRAASPR
jgi:hypothetical protein